MGIYFVKLEKGKLWYFDTFSRNILALCMVWKTEIYLGRHKSSLHKSFEGWCFYWITWFNSKYFRNKKWIVVGKYLSGPYMSIYPNKQENVHVMGVQANHWKDQAQCLVFLKLLFISTYFIPFFITISWESLHSKYYLLW